MCVDIKYGGREKRVLIKNIPETVPNILDTKWSSPYCLFIVLIKRVRVRVKVRENEINFVSFMKQQQQQKFKVVYMCSIILKNFFCPQQKAINYFTLLS